MVTLSEHMARNFTSVGILRTSGQIHAEASELLHKENSWVEIEVNEMGWVEDLKACGFNILGLSEGISRHKRVILNMIIRYPEAEFSNVADEGTRGMESFLMSVRCCAQSPRILFTAAGLQEAHLEFVPRDGYDEEAPDVAAMLEAFMRIRGVGTADVPNGFNGDQTTRMISVISQPLESYVPSVWQGDPLQEVARHMKHFLTWAHHNKRMGDFKAALEGAETGLAIFVDCSVVYTGNLMDPPFPSESESNQGVLGLLDFSVNSALVGLLDVSINLSQKLRNYWSIVKYATYGLETGTGVDEESGLLHRGQAYAQLGKTREAREDFEDLESLLLEWHRLSCRTAPNRMIRQNMSKLNTIRIELSKLSKLENQLIRPQRHCTSTK